MKLKDISAGQSLAGVEPTQIVSVVATVPHGDSALQIIYRLPDGTIKERLLVLADEPSGNLDAAGAKELHNLLLSFAHERHQTFVVVTHNDRLASAADLTLRLEDGRLGPA